MCGADDVGAALACRPAALQNVSDDDWRRLQHAWHDGAHRELFVASFMNGQAFLHAHDALRGRPPIAVEWRGPHKTVGGETGPAPPPVGHPYLLRCQYP